MNNPNNEYHQEIDLKEIFATLWAGKFFVIFCILIAIFLGSASLRGTIKVFTVVYKLTPVSGETAAPSLSRYSGIASIAGIQLPSSTSKDFHTYKQLLTSVEVSEKVFRNKNLVRSLFPSEWNQQLGKFTEVEKDKKSELIDTLKRFITGNKTTIYMPPNPRRLAEYITKNIEIFEDNNGILILQSQIAKPENIVSLMLEVTNATDDLMRDRYKDFSKDPLVFYKQKLSSSRSREHREALAQLIAKEEQKLMLASSSTYFTAAPIMKPSISLYPTNMDPKMILSVYLMLGLIFGVLAVFTLKFLKGNK